MADLQLGKDFNYPSKTLKKHFIGLGSSGSGKTVLNKVLIEEAALNGIPSILIDPQGDLASMAILGNKEEIKKQGVDEKKLDAFSKIEVVIFTPTSSKGIPLCINPLKLPQKGIPNEEIISILNQIASSICQILGYNLNNDKGKNAEALLYLILMYCWKNNHQLKTFDDLAGLVLELPPGIEKDAKPFIQNKKEVTELAKKIKFLTIGEKDLLFHFGVPLDIDVLLGKKTGKTRISVIYLNTLETQQEKHFFLSTLCTLLYQWMLANPSNDVQALFLIDEIAEYIPAGAKKPITKEILRLIFKQARKYGIGCVISTQNPGDIDYKAFAQFGTWAVGRLTTRQDIAKVKDALKSLAGSKISTIISKLPTLKVGEFIFFCPDIYKDIKELKVRWLVTEHKTLAEEEVNKVISSEKRKEFEKLMVRKEHKETTAIVPKKGTNAHNLFFPLNIGQNEIKVIIEKEQKKKFLFFGPSKENIQSISLFLRPVLKTKVREMKKVMFKEKIEETDIYFDGVTGDILQFSQLRLKSYSCYDLIGLNTTELSILKLMQKNKKPMTNAEIAVKMGFTNNFAGSVMNGLMKKKLIYYTGKEGRAFLWKLLIKVGLPSSLSKVSSKDINFVSDIKSGKKVRLNIDPHELNMILNIFFNASIIEYSIVFYPLYEVALSHKGKRRVIYISGVSGNLVKE